MYTIDTNYFFKQGGIFMNIAIIDDMLMEIELLKKMLMDYSAERHLPLTISGFQSGEEFIESYQPYTYTAIFMDIFMDGLNGIETAKKIREVDKDAILIFLTSSNDHMMDAFSIHAYDYVEKPSNPSRIFQLMDDIVQKEGDLDEMYLDFISNQEHFHLPYSEISGIRTSDANYLDIIDKDGQTYKTRLTFSSVKEMFEYDTRFILLIRGILVNMDYIQEFKDNSCYLKNGVVLPANVRNFKKLQQIWTNYLFITK